MTTLQRRRLYFGLGLVAFCLALFLFIPWPAVLTLLVLLAIFLASPLTAVWHLVRDWKPATPAPVYYQPPTKEEVSSYSQGYQPVVLYTPPSSPAMPKEELFTDEVPVAQYPQQMF